MLARSWWPLQRWLAARPMLAVPLTCAPLAGLGAWWRPPATLLPAALASGIAVLAPVMLGRRDASRRRLAGRATGTALVIAQPLILAALFFDPQLLYPIVAAILTAVLIPAALPMRDLLAAAELGSESESTRARWMLPVTLTAVLLLIAQRRGSLDLAVPDLDIGMLVTIAGCGAIWIGTSMRPLLGLSIVVAILLVLSATSSVAVSPISVALAMSTPLVAWFERESSGGFRASTSAVMAVATVAAYAFDPAWFVMAILTSVTWAIAASFPARASPEQPDVRTPGVIAWSTRLFAGLEPYWRFYARAKLASDPIYDRIASEPRAWGSVLDAGCGPGLTAVLASGRGGTTAYLGIDLDDDKLLVARRALRLSGRHMGGVWRLRRERLPLTTLPVERFDTVLVLDMLHYWPDAEQATTLSQLASLLEADGRLYLREGVAGADGGAGGIERGERFTTYFGLNPETSVTFLDAARIAALIAEAGLAVESEEPMGAENRLWICRRN